MKRFLKPVIVCAVAAVGYKAVPREVRLQLPSPRWLIPAKPLQTVSIEQALSPPTKGYVTVTLLYLSNLPPNVAVELSDDVKRWREKGVALRAYSIDPVRDRDGIAKYVRDIALDVPPTWIQMPDGAECAFEQIRAVNFFTGRQIDPSQTIPLLTLVLTDRDGYVVNSYSVNVANGGDVDLADFNGALLPFNNQVTRAVREPAG
jgi:hypothetical protein